MSQLAGDRHVRGSKMKGSLSTLNVQTGALEENGTGTFSHSDTFKEAGVARKNIQTWWLDVLKCVQGAGL